jgi:hypothetical protein
VVPDEQSTVAWACDRLVWVRLQAVSEPQVQVLRPELGGAAAPVVAEPRPPATGAVRNGVEPDEHPVASRSRFPAQNRGMAHHEYLLGVEIRITFSVTHVADAQIGSSTDCACRLLRSSLNLGGQLI